MRPGMRTNLESVVEGVFHPVLALWIENLTPYATISGKLSRKGYAEFDLTIVTIYSERCQ